MENNDSVKSLRYGHLMIMTDQDHDGSHIKGLLINFIHSFWPSLLKIPSFLVEFITPIVKATHRNGKVLAFYSMPEYESWKESLGGNASGWSIKYYKVCMFKITGGINLGAQYVVLKEECHQLFPIVGSGRFITAPRIEDGDPIQDPIVLTEANPDKGIGYSFSRKWTLVFYEKQENSSKLWDIHAVYAWFDIDVGYCQVAYDVLLFEILKRANFRCTESSVGVETQLNNLASVTQVIDPKLHQHLGLFQCT
ncbi:DNA topoisomerase 2 [Camellia lanceoleosa]|uniref:DNA topoisomerase 2 n=1 Tax=Camellia lanceoleosa TaxID=1840588 RepID=A0ACC0FAK5_9ERIC|nr:DNA topoisomerase 2 [Camellia lanceoleosa]